MPRQPLVDTQSLLGLNSEASKVWDSCDSTVYFVVDKNGVNLRKAQVRHLVEGWWLHRANNDDRKVRYYIWTGETLRYEYLVAQDPRLGYDENDNVIDI